MPFPFYMAHASAVLKQHGHETTQIDACAEQIDTPEFARRVEAFRPDVIVLEISTASLETDRAVVRYLRALTGKDEVIVWCGAHSWPADQPDILASTPEVDYFMKGEYEYTILELVQAISSGVGVASIPGLLFRDPKSGMTVTNPQRTLLKNIDEYPWPDRDPLPMSSYVDAWGFLPQPNLQMWASRGCPFKCDFCIWPQFMYGGRNYRVRSEVDIVKEVKFAVERYGMKSFYFDDDTFNIGKDRIGRYAQAFRDQGVNLPWGAMSRADTFDRKTLEVLVGSGLRFIKYGVESGDQGIVDAIDKSLDLNKVRDAVKWAKDLGVAVHLTFSFGHPGETWETARRTIEFALELSPESLQFSLMQPFPGSDLYRKVKEKGLLISDDPSQYDGYSTSPVRTETLSAQDLEQILRDANERWGAHLGQQRMSRARDRIRRAGLQEVLYSLTNPRRAFEVVREAFWGG